VSVNAQHVQICDFVAKSAYTKFMATTNRFWKYDWLELKSTCFKLKRNRLVMWACEIARALRNRSWYPFSCTCNKNKITITNQINKHSGPNLVCKFTNIRKISMDTAWLDLEVKLKFESSSVLLQAWATWIPLLQKTNEQLHFETNQHQPMAWTGQERQTYNHITKMWTIVKFEYTSFVGGKDQIAHIFYNDYKLH